MDVWFTREGSEQECLFVEALSPRDAEAVAKALVEEFGEELKITIFTE